MIYWATSKFKLQCATFCPGLTGTHNEVSSQISRDHHYLIAFLSKELLQMFHLKVWRGSSTANSILKCVSSMKRPSICLLSEGSFRMHRVWSEGFLCWLFKKKKKLYCYFCSHILQAEILWLRHSAKRKQSVECTGRQPSAPKTTGKHH